MPSCLAEKEKRGLMKTIVVALLCCLPFALTTVAEAAPNAEDQKVAAKAFSSETALPGPELETGVVAKHTIHFDRGRVVAAHEANKELASLARLLREKPGQRHVLISGHTDDLGSKAVNQRIAKSRVDSIRLELIIAGAGPEQMLLRALGESAPLVRCHTLRGKALSDARSKNRRVEIVIKEGNSKQLRIATRAP